jgi:LytS/YehU family sensor histidine kinase
MLIMFNIANNRRRWYRQDTWDLVVFVMTAMVIGLGITISFIQKWNEEVQLRQLLQQEKVSSELAMLKAQINPHFFSNTLNNIYSYTLTDGDIARDAITNLSKMMRYVLYETTAEKTLLSKEIEFIEEYIALMKLRITEKTKVTCVVSRELQRGNLMSFYFNYSIANRGKALKHFAIMTWYNIFFCGNYSLHPPHCSYICRWV